MSSDPTSKGRVISEEESEGLGRLLSELAQSVSGRSTRTSVVRGIAVTLARHLPLQRFEMGFVAASGEGIERVLARKNNAEAQRDEANAEDAWLVAASEGIEPWPPFLVQTGRISRRKQVAFWERNKDWLQFPLYEGETCLGYAQMQLATQESLETWLQHPYLEPLGGLLGLIHRNLSLVERIARVSRRAHQENKRLREQIERYTYSDTLVAQSPTMKAILEQARQVARYDTTVLLLGESGTGKERLARYIHQISTRARKPFLQLNCGAFPEGLVESELFGHEKGAFTGATRRHIGCFERAHGGTLLLDEVAELPLSMQVKLLRVLQEGQFVRVGGEEVVEVDVRLLAATHQPLEQWVKQNAFRADLYYRLNVFPIALPPLRQREEDLPLLVHEILSKLSNRLQCPPPRIHREILALLQKYPWPGNIRELENVLERAIILSTGTEDSFSHSIELSIPTQNSTSLSNAQPPSSQDSLLPASTHTNAHIEKFPTTPEAHETNELADNPATNDPMAPFETFEQASRRCIQHALEQTSGRIYGPHGAAALLQLKPTTLQSKIKKLGIGRKSIHS